MLVFVVVQFCGELPRQLKASEEAINGNVLNHVVFGIDDLKHQPPLLLVHRFNKRLMALLDLLLLRRELRWAVEAVVQIFQ